MKPYEVEKLPIEYNKDKDLLRLLSEASEKYGQYKVLLNSTEFDPSFFLDSILLSDSFKSTQIEGTQISQDEVYYLKYKKKETDDSLEIKNLKKTVEYGYKAVSTGHELDLYLVNSMHKILLDSVRGAEKKPGEIRTIQNWIGPRGVGIEGATFIPPKPEVVVSSLIDLYKYMNDEFIDPFLINVAISHAQFETIHPYNDGNGRLGRALIPIQMAVLDNERPILYLSEVIEMYKLNYHRSLMESRRGNLLGFIKFFLQCVIEQCNSYIYKLNLVNKIYREDMQKIESFKGNSIYKLMPAIMREVVFTKKEIIDETGLARNTVSRLIDKLVDLNILVKDETVVKSGYRYQRIYEVFAGIKEYY